MTVSELRRLKDLEPENAKLKRLLADLMRDSADLKGLRQKTPDARTPPGCREKADGPASVHGTTGVQAGRDFTVKGEQALLASGPEKGAGPSVIASILLCSYRAGWRGRTGVRLLSLGSRMCA